MRRVAIVIGTRPEAIKLAPVTAALRAIPGLHVRVIATGQHRTMLDQTFADLDLAADIDLDLMRPGQSLADFAGRCLAALGATFARERPDYVVGQGDTATALAAAHAAYLAGLPFGHVEAGLRSGDPDMPFPEEKNRTLVAQLATHHFCPTPAARANLLRERIAPAAVHMTGNPVIDTLLALAPERQPATGTRILVTVHRRENHAGISGIVAALKALLARRPDAEAVWPMHPNPNVAEQLHPVVADEPRLRLIPPLSYRAFVAEMARATLILTDSGGVQEEAPALGTPVLVLRRKTERPEGVVAGVARLIGTEPVAIIQAVDTLLDDPAAYADMARGLSPYGDGQAGPRIAGIVARYLLATPSSPAQAGVLL